MPWLSRLMRLFYEYLIFLVLTFYTISFGILTRKGRQCVRSVLTSFNISLGPTGTVISNSLSRVAIDCVISNELIEIVEPMMREGNVGLDELMVISGIIKKETPRRIFEIGTFDGRTTLNMAYSSEQDCEIFTLDLPSNGRNETKHRLATYDRTLVDKQPVGNRIVTSDLLCKRKITQLYGDSATYDFTPYYHTCDLVFVDAAHDYENALNDSRTAVQLIGNRNGVILWHDYKPNCDVVRALNTLRELYPELKMFQIAGTTLAYCRVLGGDSSIAG
jgi:predicted O-methyltransferase YrrM